MAPASDEAHDKVAGTGDERERQKKAEHAGQRTEPENIGEGRSNKAAHQDPAPSTKAGADANGGINANF